jgi:hypothetical protein
MTVSTGESVAARAIRHSGIREAENGKRIAMAVFFVTKL